MQALAREPSTSPKNSAPSVARPQAPNDIEPERTASSAAGEFNADDTKSLRVVELVGDIFDAPPNSVIIHACNCYGHWGAGIALAFKRFYPAAHTCHLQHCKSRSPDNLIGTAQLISPSSTGKRKHYVGCLFTSRRLGKFKDSPTQILSATGPSMRDLLEQIAEEREKGIQIDEVRICQINSGLFNVPWKSTKSVLESIEVSGNMPDVVTVFVRP